MTATTRARAWAIRRADGRELGFTDHDNILEFEQIVFRPDHGLTSGALVQSVGLSIDNTEVEGALTDDAITEGDILAGRWDGAILRMWDVDWNNTEDRRLMFKGSLGEVSRSNGAFRAELRGLTEPLNQSRGRVYHPRCSAKLGDTACKVDLGDPKFHADAIVQTCLNGRLLSLSGAGGFDGRWFERGVLRIETGAAEGFAAKIKNDRLLSNDLREIELWTPLPAEPAANDTVKLIAGCDRSAASCRYKFANFLNFRGFPHLPSEDWLATPKTEVRRSDRPGFDQIFGGIEGGKG